MPKNSATILINNRMIVLVLVFAFVIAMPQIVFVLKTIFNYSTSLIQCYRYPAAPISSREFMFDEILFSIGAPIVGLLFNYPFENGNGGKQMYNDSSEFQIFNSDLLLTLALAWWLPIILLWLARFNILSPKASINSLVKRACSLVLFIISLLSAIKFGIYNMGILIPLLGVVLIAPLVNTVFYFRQFIASLLCEPDFIIEKEEGDKWPGHISPADFGFSVLAAGFMLACIQMIAVSLEQPEDSLLQLFILSPVIHRI